MSEWITESMKKLGRIQKSMPKWKRKSQTTSLNNMKPTCTVFRRRISYQENERVEREIPNTNLQPERPY
jgi:hypothetical protein